MVLSTLHTNRYKLKGSEDFNGNNIGLASGIIVIFVILQASMISADDLLQTFNIALMLSGHVSTTYPNAKMR